MSANCFSRSSIFRKAVMSVTGLVLFLFIIGHLVGNLGIFLGPDAFNSYAHLLKSKMAVLWVVRLALLAMLVMHVTSAIALTLENRAARPITYSFEATREASYASRTMMISGLALLLFMAFHLAHFTAGLVLPQYSTQHEPMMDAGGNPIHDPSGKILERHDVHAMVIRGFSEKPVALFYVLAMALLCAHLSHGTKSFLQSLGIYHPLYSKIVEKASVGIALAIFLGYISIPLAVQAGMLKLALPAGGN